MSVIVKGMKMPKSCGSCRFNISSLSCAITGSCIDRDDEYRERLSDCPISALPDHHGRLVDADELEKAVACMVPYAIDDASSSAYTDGIGAAYYLICDAPTIVETEGENG